MDLSSILGLLNPSSWIEKGVRYFRRPRLHIYFDPDETFLTRNLVDLNNELGFFCHLMVSNDGKEVAKNCNAYLIKVKIKNENGVYESHPDFLNPIILKWAHEADFSPKDIDPDIPKRLDLCFAVQPRPSFFSFFTRRFPSGNRIDYPPGDYLVTVRVRANNATSSDESFYLSYKGVWNNFEISKVSGL